MQLSDFDYHLPSELIAQQPAQPRDSARLLNCVGQSHAHKNISDLPDILQPGDVMVVNNTKVIPALMTGTRGAGKLALPCSNVLPLIDGLPLPSLRKNALLAPLSPLKRG